MNSQKKKKEIKLEELSQYLEHSALSKNSNCVLKSTSVWPRLPEQKYPEANSSWIPPNYQSGYCSHIQGLC